MVVSIFTSLKICTIIFKIRCVFQESFANQAIQSLHYTECITPVIINHNTGVSKSNRCFQKIFKNTSFNVFSFREMLIQIFFYHTSY